MSRLESSDDGAAAAVAFAIDLDHDVVLVDVEDDATARAAVDAALDDAVVVAALDAADAGAALARLHAAVPPFLVASSLMAVVVAHPQRGTTVVPVLDELRGTMLDGSIPDILVAVHRDEPVH